MTNVLNVRTDSTWMTTIIVLIPVPKLLLNQNVVIKLGWECPEGEYQQCYWYVMGEEPNCCHDFSAGDSSATGTCSPLYE